MILDSKNTIAAIATAYGEAGIGVIRISGTSAKAILKKITGVTPKPRYAHYCHFKNSHGQIIDAGLALYFPAPHSFTGEDVVELQGHGGPVILDMLLEMILEQGARLAKPGEFSERAFLNEKMDLTQAEAIADLIGSHSRKAAHAAMQSLQGVFSKRIHEILTLLIELRIFVEAAIDFPEEEIDFLSESSVSEKINRLKKMFAAIIHEARQGMLLQTGMRVVIVGKPNAGKSSLLNCLSGKDAAIVTDIPGTTRDVLKEYIQIDGMPLHIIDTAGLRETTDKIEQEGIARAQAEIKIADHILYLMDIQEKADDEENLKKIAGTFTVPVTFLINKIDLLKRPPEKKYIEKFPVIYLSAKTSHGLLLLHQHLKSVMGYAAEEPPFIARKRHMESLQNAFHCVKRGEQVLTETRAGELLAEELKYAQNALNQITGEFTSDDLLGEIFRNFCIGK